MKTLLGRTLKGQALGPSREFFGLEVGKMPQGIAGVRQRTASACVSRIHTSTPERDSLWRGAGLWLLATHENDSPSDLDFVPSGCRRHQKEGGAGAPTEVPARPASIAHGGAH